jgi:phosphohistidine phosphatase
MKRLSILRHAKSSWKDVADEDHDRPLAGRGQRDIPVIAGQLAKLAPPPDLVLCSTARRARDTAVAVLAAADCDAEVRMQRRLYLASPATWRAALAELPSEVGHALVVGHNPGLEELLAELAGEREELPTAAMARVELAIESWSELVQGARGELVGVWRPRELSAPTR